MSWVSIEARGKSFKFVKTKKRVYRCKEKGSFLNWKINNEILERVYTIHDRSDPFYENVAFFIVRKVRVTHIRERMNVTFKKKSLITSSCLKDAHVGLSIAD
jgi:hypothetical protein